jgi:[ribosomal protein S5]-alanine N-acetyltransferase
MQRTHPLTAKTSRLQLREMTPDDAVDAFRLNSDPEVLRHTGDEAFASVEAAREFLSNYSDYRHNGFGRWAVERIEDGAFLGWCGLKRLEDGEVDLGYRLMREYWGKGYATEAARECLRVGFEEHGLESIIGRAARENHASIRVLEKVGMKFLSMDPYLHDGGALIYRMTAGEWRKADP